MFHRTIEPLLALCFMPQNDINRRNTLAFHAELIGVNRSKSGQLIRLKFCRHFQLIPVCIHPPGSISEVFEPTAVCTPTCHLRSATSWGVHRPLGIPQFVQGDIYHFSPRSEFRLSLPVLRESQGSCFGPMSVYRGSMHESSVCDCVFL